MLPQASLLSVLIWLPILGGAATLLLSKRPELTRWFALAITIITFVLSLQLYTDLDQTSAAMQFVQDSDWIRAFAIRYHLGVDGISVALVLLTTAVSVLVFVGAWRSVSERVAQYHAAFLILEGMLIGVFCALDTMLFYLFFEAMLIPMFIIIGVWGGPRRVYASLKFFLYTFLGSVFFLIALIYLYLKGGSFQLADMAALPLTATEQTWIFFAFFMAFAIKVPMFPVHTWLPDAHVEAPTGGSVVLAAIMLKVGGYGFLRYSLPIVPDASQEWAWLMVALSLIAIVGVGLVAVVQADMKKLVAYSSIAHMGLVTLGIFVAIVLVRESSNGAAAQLGLQGAMVQMISHGFISGAMFSCVGVLYDRLHTRNIADYGGVMNKMPWFGFFFVLFAMANCGLPGTSGFVGEFMVILSVFQDNAWIAIATALSLIIAAGFSLWLVKRILYGEVGNANVATMKDISGNEVWMLTVFAVAVLALGIYPKPVTDLMQSSVAQLATQIIATKL
jgi:NADH-quinone oxidoreductase subunit M